MIDFVGTLQSDDLIGTICNHFESTILLYNMTADFGDIVIKQKDQLSTHITFKDTNDSKKFSEMFNNTKLHLYDKEFSISCIEDGCVSNVYIKLI